MSGRGEHAQKVTVGLVVRSVHGLLLCDPWVLEDGRAACSFGATLGSVRLLKTPCMSSQCAAYASAWVLSALLCKTQGGFSEHHDALVQL